MVTSLLVFLPLIFGQPSQIDQPARLVTATYVSVTEEGYASIVADGNVYAACLPDHQCAPATSDLVVAGQSFTWSVNPELTIIGTLPSN